MRAFYAFVAHSFGLAGRYVFDWRVEGLENVPPGRCILAANHISVVDPPFISGTMPTRYVAWLAKEDLYPMGYGVLGRILDGLDCIRLRQDATDFKALRLARAQLEREGAVGIFPEGGINRGGGQAGVALLAHMTRAPVIPVGITGTDRLWNNGRPGTIRVRFGRPLAPPPGGKLGEEARLVYTERLMGAIVGLRGD